MEQTLTPAPGSMFWARPRGEGGFLRGSREGWAYDEIARDEHVSPERIRQIVRKFSTSG